MGLAGAHVCLGGPAVPEPLVYVTPGPSARTPNCLRLPRGSRPAWGSALCLLLLLSLGLVLLGPPLVMASLTGADEN